MNPHLDSRRLLKPIEDIETPTSTIAPQFVGAIGDALQLLKHKPRDDHWLVDHPRSATSAIRPSITTDVSSTSGRGALDLFREFHVRNDKPKIVLGLEER